jgi:hypothetical protein
VPYFERLGDAKASFRVDLWRKLGEALPGTPVFYPFKRTLFSARRPR